MSDTTQQTGAGEQSQGGEQQATDAKQEQTFTQADLDKIVKERVQRERAKFADYDDLKAKAGEKATIEERLAAMEKRATEAELRELRAKFAADVPEKLRPLLTGSTEDELKAQRDLLVESDTERKKQGNYVPKEGTSTRTSSGDDSNREFLAALTGRDQ